MRWAVAAPHLPEDSSLNEVLVQIAEEILREFRPSHHHSSRQRPRGRLNAVHPVRDRCRKPIPRREAHASPVPAKRWARESFQLVLANSQLASTPGLVDPASKQLPPWN